MILLFILFLQLIYTTNCQFSTPYVSGTCSSSQFYSSINLTCSSCSINASQSSNGLSCVCKAGYRYTKNGGGGLVLCEKCESNTVPSTDGWSCVSCLNVISGRSCGALTSNQIWIDRDILGSQGNASYKSCVGRYRATNNQCQLCTNILNTNTNSLNCDCSSPSKTSDNACLTSADINANKSNLLYAGKSVISGFLIANMMDSYALCEAGIESGCQNLANMCTMAVFNKNSIKTNDGTPCSLYNKLQAEKLSSKLSNYPWLYFPDSLTLTQLTIDHQYVRNEVLQIILATYDSSGQFLGLRNATQDSYLQLCSNSILRRNETYRFGTRYTESCSISISQLLNQSVYTPIFYDLYLSYTDSTGTKQLFAIPIKIGQVVSESGSTPNMLFDQSSWIFTRRLLLVDNFGSVSPPFQTNKTADYVTYASSMRLVVVKQYTGSFDITTDGKIYAPYLEVNLTTVASTGSGTFANISFEVVYYNNAQYLVDFSYSLSVSMGVLCAFSGLYSILRAFFWCRRSGISGFEGLVLLKVVAHACASIANVFFIVIFGISLYFLLLYKNQTLFSIIPPHDDAFFVAYLISAFLLKLLEIIHIFVTQCTIDVFLIDWERPKHLHAPKKVIERSKFDYTDNTGDQNLIQQQQQQEKAPVNTGVSIWRTYFIANEWNEIQTYRKTSLIFNLVTVLLFMEVIGFKNITTFDCFVNYNPSSNGYTAPSYRMFRFAVIVSIFGITAFLQWLFTVLIYERVVEDKLRNYVDLCSVANVSVFVLAHRQFGYYIHGRSVHGTADVSLAEMYVSLQKENAGSCAKRGLENDSMQQTYIMALPSDFRNCLDNVYRPIGRRMPEDSRNMQYLEVNKFLDRFINRTHIPRISFRFQDRKFFEDVFDGEFEDNSIEGRFYRDNGTSFGNVLFYGQELALITFDILLFCVVDLILQNTVFDAFITWGLVTILKMIRNGCGAYNLANKTLVDRRFLI